MINKIIKKFKSLFNATYYPNTRKLTDNVIDWKLYINQQMLLNNGDIILCTGIAHTNDSTKIFYNNTLNNPLDEKDIDKIILRDPTTQMTESEIKEIYQKLGDKYNDYSILELISILKYEFENEAQDWLTIKGFAIRNEFENQIAIKK